MRKTTNTNKGARRAWRGSIAAGISWQGAGDRHIAGKKGKTGITREPTPYHSGSVQHEGVERSRSKRYLEAAFGGIGIGECERTLLVEGVLCHNHHRAVRVAEGDGH